MPGMLPAINSDGERLGHGSQLGLSTLPYCLPCPALPSLCAESCKFLPLDCLMQIQFRSQATDVGDQGHQEG